MKKLAAVFALLVVVTSIVGCKASAEIDPDTATSISLPR